MRKASWTGAQTSMPASVAAMAATRIISAPFACIGIPDQRAFAIGANAPLPAEDRRHYAGDCRLIDDALVPAPELTVTRLVLSEQLIGLGAAHGRTGRDAVRAHAVIHADEQRLAARADQRVALGGGVGRCRPSCFSEGEIRIARPIMIEHRLVTGERRGESDLLRHPVDVRDAVSRGRLDQAARPLGQREDELADAGLISAGDRRNGISEQRERPSLPIGDSKERIAACVALSSRSGISAGQSRAWVRKVSSSVADDRSKSAAMKAFVSDAEAMLAKYGRRSGEIDSAAAEREARRLAEKLALALQASLVVRFGSPAVADAFCASRIVGNAGYTFGTLPGEVATDGILDAFTSE